MKRTHDSHLDARKELVAAGFTTLGAPCQPLRWARPEAPNDVRVVRREVIDADERWVIEKQGA